MSSRQHHKRMETRPLFVHVMSLQAWLANNSATVVAVDSDAPEVGLASFGEHWQGPYNASQYPWVASGSVIDLFNAAVLAPS